MSLVRCPQPTRHSQHAKRLPVSASRFVRGDASALSFSSAERFEDTHLSSVIAENFWESCVLEASDQTHSRDDDHAPRSILVLLFSQYRLPAQSAPQGHMLL